MKSLTYLYDMYYGTTPEEKAIRKLVEPITALVTASILPLFEEGSKIGVVNRRIVVQ